MPAPQSASTTFHEHGSQRLRALCGAIGFDQIATAGALALFRSLLHPWGERAIGAQPRWPSDITDDHTPYEFSLAVERHRPELRMLVEAQAEEPTVFAQWAAGRALARRLGTEWGAGMARLTEVADVFAVEDAHARFGMWHALNLRAGAEPELKVYLNPQARGPARAVEVVKEALTRLGFAGALAALPLTARDEVKYFSLDLSDNDDARVKVYLVHYRSTCADMESALSAAANYVDGEATEFCRAMSGSVGPYVTMPLQSCYSFTRRGGDRPVAATLYFPVRAYAENDGAARRRILDYMIAEDRPLYERALAAFADRDLEAGTGMQTYASYRRQNFFRRVTVYLSPEAYSLGPRRLVNDPVSGVMTTPNMGDELTSGHTSAVPVRGYR